MAINKNKYRVWDIRKQEMVSDALILTETRQLISVDEQFNNQFAFFDGCIWMQYSGYDDRDKTEIYEADIVEVLNADGELIKALCEFGKATREIFENTVDIHGFYFLLENGKKTFPIVNNYDNKHDLEIFKVIGNKYKTPELFNEKHIDS